MANSPTITRDPSKPDNLRDLIAALQSTGVPNWAWPSTATATASGIVTNDGHTIYPDRQMMLFAQDVLSRVPGGAYRLLTSNARNNWLPLSALRVVCR
jgi:phosphomannomutase